MKKFGLRVRTANYSINRTGLMYEGTDLSEIHAPDTQI